jgi:hypothetical protein
VRHPISAGFAAVDVTPSGSAVLSGFAVREAPSVGVHDPLYARAMVLDDGHRRVAVIVLDVIGVDAALVRTVRSRLAAQAGVGPDDVFVAATHTHGGPAVLVDALLGAVDPMVRARLAAGAVAAAVAAIAALAPAEVEVAMGREDTVAHNRRVPDGPIDPDVPVVVVRRAGDVVGVVTGYACHPVTLGADNRWVTRDYPGFVVDALEAHWPGSVALFLTGCSGQVNTGHAASASLSAAPAARRTFAEARRLGQRLARVVVDQVDGGAARAIAGRTLRVAHRRVSLPFGPPATAPSEDLQRWRAALTDPREAACWPLIRAQVAWAERVLSGAPRGAEVVEAACLGFGELAFAWFPGEVFVEHGLDLKAAVASEGPVVTVANALDAQGYVPYRTAYPAGGYEVEEAFRYYGRPGPFLPTAGERLAAAMLELVDGVRR